MGRKLAAAAFSVSLIAAVTLALFEVAVRFIKPQPPQLYPRYRYSERFGHLLPESATIVHQKPGAYGTPEGHPWGPKGHRIVAEHLALALRTALGAGVPPVGPQAADVTYLISHRRDLP